MPQQNQQHDQQGDQSQAERLLAWCFHSRHCNDPSGIWTMAEEGCVAGCTKTDDLGVKLQQDDESCCMPSALKYKFDPFEADVNAAELRRSGTRLKLQLQPFQVLLAL